ncbi:MAG TPA: prolipoprotein diacylglyceryl transferase [Myxococcota bacterium]|nr:prolipoprotein diacylglyceryl transferase [Myxococcota bacterium]HRY93109.1 prolipoprotein diacylglyceryl transferase [Myxococcota bacterium]HSA20359.1 prolipoprotein diacylglyceryl transferase [Myxococcota bacterium]
MHPVLLEFRFPEFLGHLGWLELGLTALALGGLYLWRFRRPGFDPRGFLFWAGLYLLARGLAYAAGPGYEFKLHTYGVMIALGFAVGIYLGARQARREGLSPDVVLDLSFWVLIASMIGSRVLFIIVNLDDYTADPWLVLKVWQGGLVFYGGFIGAVLASLWFCRRKGVSFLRIADIVIPSVAIGHAFGRLGCFSAGCCHGYPTGSESFGAIFTATGTVVAKSNMLGIPLHPTQLYESVGELLIFFALLLIRTRKRFHGQVLISYLILYPILRSVGEMFRGDVERGMLVRLDLFGDARPELLSTSQLISMGVALVGVVLLVALVRRRAGQERRETAPPADAGQTPTQPSGSPSPS